MERHLVLEGVKKAFCEQTGISRSDVLFCFHSAKADQFILKGSRGMFWGKIFYSPADNWSGEDLCREYAHLRHAVREEVLPVLFIPGSEFNDPIYRLKELPQQTVFFEYTSEDQNPHNIKLSGRRIKVPALQRPPEVATDTVWGDGHSEGEVGYNFFKQGLLNRDELLELLEISLDLARIRPVDKYR